MVKAKRNARVVGVSLSAAALALVATEGVAGATPSVPLHIRGVVTSVGSGTITVRLPDGTAQTIATTPATTYAERGSSVAPTGVVNGESVAVTLNPADTTPTASTVTVLLDRISGRVVSVSGSTISLASDHGVRQFQVTPTTRYSALARNLQSTNAASGLTVGEFVIAFGEPSAASAPELVAQFVDVANARPQPAMAGEVGRDTRSPFHPFAVPPQPVSPEGPHFGNSPDHPSVQPASPSDRFTPPTPPPGGAATTPADPGRVQPGSPQTGNGPGVFGGDRNGGGSNPQPFESDGNRGGSDGTGSGRGGDGGSGGGFGH